MELGTTLLTHSVCYHPDGFLWIPNEGGFRVLEGKPFVLIRYDDAPLPHDGWRSLGTWQQINRNPRDTA